MKLTSMTDFVFSQINQKQSCSEFKESVKKYAELLKKPLELRMFVPCDELGKVLEEPQSIKETFNVSSGSGGFFDSKSFVSYIVKYEKAKESLLFNYFEIQKDTYNQTKRTFYKIGEYKICLVMEFYTGRKEIIYNYKEKGNTIEDLINQDLTLSENAIKQLNLWSQKNLHKKELGVTARSAMQAIVSLSENKLSRYDIAKHPYLIESKKYLIYLNKTLKLWKT